MPANASQKSGGNTLAPPVTSPTTDKAASESPKNINIMFLSPFLGVFNRLFNIEP